MINIGLISDTHGVINEDWKKFFNRCDMLIHAGDFDSGEAYEWFTNLKQPLHAVKGNCDWGFWARVLPATLTINAGGKNICIIHNRAYLPDNLDGIDYVIFGHTHIVADKTIEGIRFINPGTASRDRGSGRSMAILHLEGDDCELEFIRL